MKLTYIKQIPFAFAFGSATVLMTGTMTIAATAVICCTVIIPVVIYDFYRFHKQEKVVYDFYYESTLGKTTNKD